MIPTLLARQLRDGVADYLRTTFPTATPLFAETLNTLLAEPDTLVQGPYISVGLPFVTSEASGDWFTGFTLPFPPYAHQARAYARLTGPHARGTLVATGTGSGKTESFLLPILEHCWQHKGQPGVKALLIYPMNALATDQARRLAKLIFDAADTLRGHVRAGLWVGENDDTPRGVMEAGGIITDKQVMAQNPPDILLTNYKMLDILLNRPKDQGLWAKNAPNTLRFVAVDELHTFDGAQGTDLACLLRRLKARLGTPPGHLVSIGTSATLGGPDAADTLRAYATDIFGEDFDADAVITESRLDAATFLAPPRADGEKTLPTPTWVEQALPPADALSALAADPGLDDEALVRALVPLFFEQPPAPGPAFAREVGEALKRHVLFHALLRALDGQTLSLDALCDALGRALPAWLLYTPAEQRLATEALLALVAYARQAPGRPFVQLRVQMWLRELRRMVATLAPRPRLRLSADLNEQDAKQHLPLLHCRECGQMGWGGVKPRQATRLNPDLKTFYEAWFSDDTDVVMLLPDEPNTPAPAFKTLPARVCGECLALSTDVARNACGECGAEALLPVLVPQMTRATARGEEGIRDCPACEGENALSIVGAQSASLSSVLIGQLFATRLNDDKKLLTFSDSVQDAAHRASFFAARTHPFGLRTALAAWLHDPATPAQTLRSLPDAFANAWRARLGETSYIAQFLPPDLAWLRPYAQMLQTGSLPEKAEPLPHYLDQRVAWDLTCEFTWRSRIGRTLEKSGLAVAAPNAEWLEKAVEALMQRVPAEVPLLANLQAHEARLLLSGLLRQLRLMGAVDAPGIPRYLENFCKPGVFKYLRFLPPLGPGKRPRFVGSRATRYIETWVRAPGYVPSPFQSWAARCLQTPDRPLLESLLPEVLHIAVQALQQHRLLDATEVKDTTLWGLRRTALDIHIDATLLRCNTCGQRITVAAHETATWEHAPCPQRRCDGRLAAQPARLDYYARLYRDGELARVFAAEHTGLLPRTVREAVETSFMRTPVPPASVPGSERAKPREPWDLNVLSCTPTLEMGIDIGDLSTVLLCSVPPRQASYLQRIGRAGRRDGNALTLTVANARPHDLYFFADPLEMIQGRIEPPGVFLGAAAVLERQLTAYCLDQWVATGVPVNALPHDVRGVLSVLKTENPGRFPFNFLQWVAAQEDALLQGFFALFSPGLAAEPRQYLEKFIRGHDTPGHALRFKILQAFAQQAAELDSLLKRIRQLDDKLKKLDADPAKPLNYADQRQEIEDARGDLQAVAQQMQARPLYGFLSDEGILPNYAFPEAGVTLRSIIYWQREEGDNATGKRYERKVFQYDRPASAALGELAPGSLFYAEGRRVEIDQIDMGVADPETWRFCPECSYARIERAGDVLEPACPRCGAAMWVDAGQKHTLLRIRQVFASTPDRDSRAVDTKDERERSFFVRNLLVDAPPEAILAAYRLKSTTFPFGFEFLSRATFREINFGERDRQLKGWPSAGEAIQSKGFRLCKHCGKIQKGPQRLDASGTKPEHALTCPARNKDAPNTIVPAMNLYREFSSEALRVLLPVAGPGAGEVEVKSLAAALQLGLSLFYQGAIDHLRITRMTEPDRETGFNRHFLVLYDSVPGGTGYLKQLVAAPDTLTEVFRRARDHIRACVCGQVQVTAEDDEGPLRPADGCYRCVWAYRNSNDMAEISRQTALGLLGELLAQDNEWEAVPTLAGVGLSGLSESVLEDMFLARLKTAAGASWQQDLRGGRHAFSAQFGDHVWDIAQQVDFGLGEGVTAPCRADFVLTPRTGTSPPVVVFTDGYAFHRNRLDVDAKQRTALLRAGYRVFSLSYKDVDAPETPHGADPFALPTLPGGANLKNTVANFAARAGVQPLEGLSTHHTWALLLKYLTQPVEAAWHAQALGLCLASYGPHTPTPEAWQAALGDRLPPEIAVTLAPKDAFYIERSAGLGPLYLYLDRQAIQAGNREGVLALLATPAEAAAADAEAEAQWHTSLRAANVLQFLPGFAWLGPGQPCPLWGKPLPVVADEVPVPDAAAVVAEGWLEDVRKQLLNPPAGLLALLARLEAAGAPAPEIGYELKPDGRPVEGMAEVAWPGARVAWLLEHEVSYTAVFEHAGWRTWPVAACLESDDVLHEVITRVCPSA